MPVGNVWPSVKDTLTNVLLVGAVLGLFLYGVESAYAAPSDNQASGQKSSSRGKGSQVSKKSNDSAPLGPSRLTDKILLALEAKRRAVAQRQMEIRREESRLNELRADIKKRIATLKKIENRLQKTIKKMDSGDKKSIDHLVRAYSAMGADEAAKLMNTMNLNLAVRILREMQVKKAGSILAVVEPRRAARISEKLARAEFKN